MAAGFTKFLFIPIVLLLGQVDFKEDHILNMARVGFFVSIAITLATNAFIKRKVLAANDTTSIWVPPPQSGFLPDPNAKLVKSTYLEFETNLIGENNKKGMIMLAMMSFLTFKMGIHLPLAIQACMLPMELFTSPIAGKYLLGSKTATPYDEKLEPPEEGEDAAAGAAGAAGAGGAGAGATMTDDEARAATGAAAVDTSPNSPTGKLLDFVVDHWNEESSFTVADANKVLVDGADINAQTPVEAVEGSPGTMVGGMTLLMVACGFPASSKKLITTLVTRGASLMATDHDSWTALHWAAEYGATAAAQGLFESCSAEELRFMLQHRDNEGKTALELATARSHDAVAALIRKFSDETEDLDTGATAASAAAPAAAAACTDAGADDVADID